MGKEVESHPGWLRPGVVLRDTYLVGRPLGHGGFGITYLGVDLKLDIRVAIKEYLPRDLATRNPNGQTVEAFPDAREVFQHGRKRFMDEARVLARFGEHPNIVSVLGFFEANESAYLVMRYLEGQDVAWFIKSKGGRVPAVTAVEIILPVLKGLQTVHGAGLLHRDIKPQNIYLARDGDVKLLDFGAARYALLENSKTLTTILTPGYAAPEMYDPKDKVGPYTDVYSVGATLHEMLTGESPKDIFSRVGEDSLLPPAAIDASIDNELSAIVYKALTMEPSGRYQTAHSFMNALNGLNLRGSGRRRVSSTKTQWVIADPRQDIAKEEKPATSRQSYHPTQPAPQPFEQTNAQASLHYGQTHPAAFLNNSAPADSPVCASHPETAIAETVSAPSSSNVSSNAPMTGPGPGQIVNHPGIPVTGPAVSGFGQNHSQEQPTGEAPYPSTSPQEQSPPFHSPPFHSEVSSGVGSGTPGKTPITAPSQQIQQAVKSTLLKQSGHPLMWFLAAFVVIGLTAVGTVVLFKWLTQDDQRDHKQEIAASDNGTSENPPKKEETGETTDTDNDDETKKNTVMIDGIEIQKTLANVPECLRYVQFYLCFMEKSLASGGGQDLSAYRPLYASQLLKGLDFIADPGMPRSVVESTCKKMIHATWKGATPVSAKNACKEHIKKSDLD